MDFQTALGRLLRDAALRKQFASDPSEAATHLGLRASEREHFVALSAEAIEVQATILLRKRFEAVSRLLPDTMARLGGNAWECFLAHAGCYWPKSQAMAFDDAKRFCSHLAATRQTALCPVELNRLRFHGNRRPLDMHYVREFRIRGRARRALQLLIRRGRGWSEHALYFALD